MKKVKKLSLDRQTLRNLTPQEPTPANNAPQAAFTTWLTTIYSQVVSCPLH